MAKKPPAEKLTIEEYRNRQTLRGKRRFRIEFYPWQVLVALALPFATLIFLITVYVMHIKGIAN